TCLHAFSPDASHPDSLPEQLLKTNHGMVKLKDHTLSPAAQEFICILNQVEDRLCTEENDYFSNASGFVLDDG
ncbi:MAG: hypothetical protein U9Q71_00215, partial [Pseudomonadota bacterium]|nr:hypothetical protein [Pseudomonadota bacterium]